MEQEWFLKVIVKYYDSNGIEESISPNHKRVIIKILNSLDSKPISCDQPEYQTLEFFYELNSSLPFEAQVEADEIMGKVIDPLLKKRGELRLTKFTIHQGAISIKESY